MDLINSRTNSWKIVSFEAKVAKQREKTAQRRQTTFLFIFSLFSFQLVFCYKVIIVAPETHWYLTVVILLDNVLTKAENDYWVGKETKKRKKNALLSCQILWAWYLKWGSVLFSSSFNTLHVEVSLYKYLFSLIASSCQRHVSCMLLLCYKFVHIT